MNDKSALPSRQHLDKIAAKRFGSSGAVVTPPPVTRKKLETKTSPTVIQPPFFIKHHSTRSLALATLPSDESFWGSSNEGRDDRESVNDLQILDTYSRFSDDNSYNKRVSGYSKARLMHREKSGRSSWEVQDDDHLYENAFSKLSEPGDNESFFRSYSIPSRHTPFLLSKEAPTHDVINKVSLADDQFQGDSIELVLLLWTANTMNIKVITGQGQPAIFSIYHPPDTKFPLISSMLLQSAKKLSMKPSKEAPSLIPTSNTGLTEYNSIIEDEPRTVDVEDDGKCCFAFFGTNNKDGIHQVVSSETLGPDDIPTEISYRLFCYSQKGDKYRPNDDDGLPMAASILDVSDVSSSSSDASDWSSESESSSDSEESAPETSFLDQLMPSLEQAKSFVQQIMSSKTEQEETVTESLEETEKVSETSSPTTMVQMNQGKRWRKMLLLRPPRPSKWATPNHMQIAAV